MRAEAGLPLRSIPTPRLPWHPRLTGAASIVFRTLRDSRAGIALAGGLIALMIVAGGAVMATTYGTLAARAELDLMARTIPAELRAFYGDPVAVGTVGGFIGWHYGAYLALIGGLWSILALSSTIAAEARRGSLEIAVAAPVARRTIGWAKVAGHLLAVALVAAGAGILAWGAGALVAVVPGDAIEPGAALLFGAGLAVRILVAGALAFALAPDLGRGAAAGIAGAVMVVAYLAAGYRIAVPGFDLMARLLPWAWPAGDLPLVGRTDGGSVAATAIAAILLLVIGVERFQRSDLGSTRRLPLPALPAVLLGRHGALPRALGELLPAAAAWGVGIVLYGLLMTSISGVFVELIRGMPEVMRIFRALIPQLDITTVTGYLQLAVSELGFLLLGLAATAFVTMRWADEAAGRLELPLATPLSRAGWALASGVAVVVALLLPTAALAIAVGAGVLLAGEPALVPALGTLILGLHGAALAGIGMAVGGILGSRAAGIATGALAVGMFLCDLLAPILRLPGWVADLSLSEHLGEPILGRLDVAGMALCIALAIGGIALGAWGLGRRDVG